MEKYIRWRRINATLQELKAYLSSVPTMVAPKPQESLLPYLAATNQGVRAALVAQREVDEAESEQRPVESEKDQDNNEHGNESNPKDEERKKVVQRPVYFVTSLLPGARSRYSGVQKLIFTSWPQGNCATTSKPTRSWLSPNSLCNAYSDTQKPRGHRKDSGMSLGVI